MRRWHLIKAEYIITELVYRRISKPIAKFLSKKEVSPNSITILSLIIGLLSSVIILKGDYIAAAILLFVSQILDCVDGDLARIKSSVTKLGSYIDRLFDRFVDFSVLLAVSYSFDLWLEGALAIFFSLMVSMTRLMAEAEGITCKVGICGRDARLLLLIIALLIATVFPVHVRTILWILIALSVVTTFQRIWHTVKFLSSKS